MLCGQENEIPKFTRIGQMYVRKIKEGGIIMGKCKYCGHDAGFLRSRHKECKQANEQGTKQIIQLITKKTKQVCPSPVKNEIMKIAQSSFIDQQSLNEICVRGWEAAVENALEDDILSKEEENALVAMKDELGLDQELLNKNGSYMKVVKAAVIRELVEGKIPQKIKIDCNIPFNLQKNEQIVWLFSGVNYCEERTRTTYQGGYSGVSFRVMKGVYYRTGGFRGNPVVTSNIVQVDNGTLAVTDKHIYFAGLKKAFRVPYSKIVAFTPYSDALGIQRDAQTAKQQIFKVDDGWFIHNLVTNLSNISKS